MKKFFSINRSSSFQLKKLDFIGFNFLHKFSYPWKLKSLSQFVWHGALSLPSNLVLHGLQTWWIQVAASRLRRWPISELCVEAAHINLLLKTRAWLTSFRSCAKPRNFSIFSFHSSFSRNSAHLDNACKAGAGLFALICMGGFLYKTCCRSFWLLLTLSKPSVETNKDFVNCLNPAYHCSSILLPKFSSLTDLIHVNAEL